MIGTRIKQIRKRNRLSKQQLADAIGTSKGYISEIERNVKTPGTEILVALKRAFGISVDWILTGEECQKDAVTDVDKVVVEHICVIQKFKNKVEAKEFNEALIKIEKIDERQFFKALGWIQNELKNLESGVVLRSKKEKLAGE